jgi:hypothetical protein
MKLWTPCQGDRDLLPRAAPRVAVAITAIEQHADRAGAVVHARVVGLSVAAAGHRVGGAATASSPITATDTEIRTRRDGGFTRAPICARAGVADGESGATRRRGAGAPVDQRQTQQIVRELRRRAVNRSQLVELAHHVGIR